MKRLLLAAAFALALAAPAAAQQTLPPNTFWGRLGAGQSGSPEAIPFATLGLPLPAAVPITGVSDPNWTSNCQGSSTPGAIAALNENWCLNANYLWVRSTDQTIFPAQFTLGGTWANGDIAAVRVAWGSTSLNYSCTVNSTCGAGTSNQTIANALQALMAADTAHLSTNLIFVQAVGAVGGGSYEWQIVPQYAQYAASPSFTISNQSTSSGGTIGVSQAANNLADVTGYICSRSVLGRTPQNNDYICEIAAWGQANSVAGTELYARIQFYDDTVGADGRIQFQTLNQNLNGVLNAMIIRNGVYLSDSSGTGPTDGTNGDKGWGWFNVPADGGYDLSGTGTLSYNSGATAVELVSASGKELILEQTGGLSFSLNGTIATLGGTGNTALAIGNGTVNGEFLAPSSGAFTIQTTTNSPIDLAVNGTQVAAFSNSTLGTFTLGNSGSNGGVLALSGATSGSVQLKVPAVAGSNAINFPAASGTVALVGTNTRVVLTAATTYYVSPTGSDTTGNGTSGNPWQTWQHAINYITYNVDCNGFGVTLQAADGDYSGQGTINVFGTLVGADVFFINGDSGNPAAVKIDSIYAKDRGTVVLTNFEIGNTAGRPAVHAQQDGIIDLSTGMILAGSTAGDLIFADTGGYINQIANITLSGNAAVAIAAVGGTYNSGTNSWLIPSALSFTDFAVAEQNGQMVVSGSSASGTGVAGTTGTRFVEDLTSSIVASTSLNALFPGNANGVGASGSGPLTISTAGPSTLTVTDTTDGVSGILQAQSGTFLLGSTTNTQVGFTVDGVLQASLSGAGALNLGNTMAGSGKLVLEGGTSGSAQLTVAAAVGGAFTVTVPGANATLLSTGGALLQATPSNPTGTSSTSSYTMAGLGGTCKITPLFSSRVEVTIDGQMVNNSSGQGTAAWLSYGTSTAPANGAALTGTQLGNAVTAQGLAATNPFAFSFTRHITGLTPGTPIWIDLAQIAVGGGTASLSQLTCTAREI